MRDSPSRETTCKIREKSENVEKSETSSNNCKSSIERNENGCFSDSRVLKNMAMGDDRRQKEN
jgi:hypothetical protein